MKPKKALNTLGAGASEKRPRSGLFQRVLQKSTIFEMAASGIFLDGGSIQYCSLGKQNMGARNLVRQALLDKRLFIAKALCPLRNMVRLAGVGHEVPAPASMLKVEGLLSL